MESSEIIKESRSIGFFSLTMMAITMIIGSGWLFGAYQAAKLAGPASIFAWIIGGIAVLLIALTVIELGTMFPKSGGMVHYLNISHGPLTGFMAAWTNWIVLVSCIPTEAVASTTYMASWNFPWAHAMFNAQAGELTGTGLIVASCLMIFYFLLNYWSLGLLIKSNNAISIYKLIVPIFTALTLIAVGFHSHNFTIVKHSFAPYGWSSVFTAIATCGIVFSFNGFQAVVSLSGEAKNPSKTIPFAIISALIFCIILYVVLQIAFIGALAPAALQHGWHHVFMSSPFAQLAITLNLNILMLLLYSDAFISPSGSGLAYMSSTARMLYGMHEHKQMPAFLGKLHPKYKIPRAALWVNLAVCFIFLFIFRGWGKLAGVISVACVISYTAGPISAITLRKVAPSLKRPFRLPFINAIAPVAFMVCALVLYWAKWPLTGKVIIVVMSGLIIYAYFQHKQKWFNFKSHLKSCFWFIAFMVTIAIISYIGGTNFGGLGYIPNGLDQIIVAGVSLIFFYWGKNTPYYKE